MTSRKPLILAQILAQEDIRTGYQIMGDVAALNLSDGQLALAIDPRCASC